MATADTSARRILVVEDDHVLRDMLVKGLRKAGYEVLSAETGEHALMLLREWGERIDWLFVDIRLPGVIDGWVVGSEFTLNHPLRPVIYASAYAPDSSRQVAGSVFMPKPVSVTKIVVTFKELMARYAHIGAKGPTALHAAAAPPADL
jgi:two-component system, OmpR family, response regulator